MDAIIAILVFAAVAIIATLTVTRARARGVRFGEALRSLATDFAEAIQAMVGRG